MLESGESGPMVAFFFSNRTCSYPILITACYQVSLHETDFASLLCSHEVGHASNPSCHNFQAKLASCCGEARFSTSEAGAEAEIRDMA